MRAILLLIINKYHTNMNYHNNSYYIMYIGIVYISKLTVRHLRNLENLLHYTLKIMGSY